jgi:hypothetical protein
MNDSAVEVTMGASSSVVSGIVADESKISPIPTVTPPHTAKCRSRLLQSVTTKRMSLALTPAEQQFVDHLLEHGDDHDLHALDINLSNTAVFLEKETVEATLADNEVFEVSEHADIASVTSSGGNGMVLGSTKRQEYLKSRMSCSKSKALWKGAALKVVSTQSLSGAVADVVAFAKDEGYDDDDDDDTVEEGINIHLHAARIRASTRSTGRLSALTIPESLAECHEDDDEDSGDDAHTADLEEEKKEDEDEEGDDGEYSHNGDDTTYDSRQPGASSMTRTSKADAATRSKRGSRPELIKTASINMYHGEGFEVGKQDSFEMYSGESGYMEHYDPWIFAELDEDGHRRIDNFHILGTAHDDLSAQPHVLSPILMQSLQEHLPHSNRGESFWLKYSLVRDGASIISFLQQVRGSRHTVLACETVDGDVFGFFGCQPWVVQPSYFGTGESFVWRMKHSRILANGEQYHDGTMIEQIHREAEIEVYPAVNHAGNQFYQLCQHDKVAVGGGVCSTPQDFGKGETPEMYQPEDIGFALVFDDENLLYGSSSACMTFQNPPLAKSNSK